MKHFSGATRNCVIDCIEPSPKNPPDHFILHVGKNDLALNQTLGEITSIINLEPLLMGEFHDVSTSSIILRIDDKRLHEKGCEVNHYLGESVKQTIYNWSVTQIE